MRVGFVYGGSKNLASFPYVQTNFPQDDLPSHSQIDALLGNGVPVVQQGDPVHLPLQKTELCKGIVRWIRIGHDRQAPAVAH